MKYFKVFFNLALFLLFTQQAIGQNQPEGISFDSTKNFYVITYCCHENGHLLKGTYIPGNLVEPKVTVKVDFLPKDGLYKYLYTVKNENSALDLLYSFSIKNHADIRNVKNPNNKWVHYSMPDTTTSWRHSRGSINGIKPGDIETDFVLESIDPPSIVTVLAASDTFTGFPDEGPSNAQLQKELAVLQKTTAHIKLKSIGPRRLADDTDITSLLDTLLSYLNFSCDTTWIENEGICRSLEAKLDNTRRKLDRTNDRTAANNLQAFLNEVMALKDEQLSSEAYALLYFNGQYLLERLQE